METTKIKGQRQTGEPRGDGERTGRDGRQKGEKKGREGVGEKND